MNIHHSYIRWFENLTSADTETVGGKNASLGEMIENLKEKGIRIPRGFATTAEAYRDFILRNELEEEIRSKLEAYKKDEISLEKAGHAIRSLFSESAFPDEIAESITDAYEKLSEMYDETSVDVAVRSSATAEDLPEASFAGQQETFLNISGAQELMEACKKCYASLFTDRAISYRESQEFDDMKVALSVGVQKMVRSDRAGAGVMFSIDTETGFPDIVVINAAWGLGEYVVQGSVTPDEYRVFKPLLEKSGTVPIIQKSLGRKEKKMIYAKGGSRKTRNKKTTRVERSSFVLSEEEIVQLGRWAVAIEDHYGKAMDMEWAKDGDSGDLFIVQARPETVQSRKESGSLKRFTLKEKGRKLAEGLSIGQSVATGKAFIALHNEEIESFEEGSILVTEMTDPDWVPIMKKAAAIVTDAGGRTSHAAIVSRELNIPAVVGTGNATEVIEDDREITVSCTGGEDGIIYDGILDYEQQEIDLDDLPETKTRIMMNIGSPAASSRWWRLPCNGIGLARMEFIINNVIKIHPMALVRFNDLEDEDARDMIEKLTRGYEDKTEYFVNRLARGISRIAAPHYPEPVLVRMSDFKTNEYADLIGGSEFEPRESNPMLGFRGASRYYSERYRDGFALECRAVRKVREQIGLDNVIVMIPFCRTVEEAKRVLEVMADNGLERGEKGLEVYIMAEIPANVILADDFAEHVDGFSIGSNDLTQLVLGVDRDSTELSHLFDARDEAVRKQISDLITAAHHNNCKVGICGQAPSDHPDFAAFLVREGIDSISLNPDSVVDVIRKVAEKEKKN